MDAAIHSTCICGSAQADDNELHPRIGDLRCRVDR